MSGRRVNPDSVTAWVTTDIVWKLAALALLIVILVLHLGVGGGTDPCSFTLDARCDDGNPCTMDGYNCGGVCVNVRAADGTACESPCLVGEAQCITGQCTGSCMGECDTDMDCPDIIDSLTIVGNPGYSFECDQGFCVYTTESIKPDGVQEDCPGSELARQLCMKHFNATVLPQAGCLAHEPSCTPTTLSCTTYFTCSCAPQPGFEIG